MPDLPLFPEIVLHFTDVFCILGVCEEMRWNILLSQDYHLTAKMLSLNAECLYVFR